jgi:hypothetical protein
VLVRHAPAIAGDHSPAIAQERWPDHCGSVYKVSLTFQSPPVEHEVQIPMRTRLASSVRNSPLKFVLSSAFVLSFATGVLAGPQKGVTVRATGQIVSTLCSDNELCQDVQVTGVATVLGRVSGVLSETVDLNTGIYTGRGTFTTADGSTITTEFAGQVFPLDQNGNVFFMETHHIIDGTGQYENASGDLDLAGTADATGALVVVGTGTLIRG